MAEKALPTKSVIAPDGTIVQYPNLPNVGESYHTPDGSTREAAPPVGSDPHARSSSEAVAAQAWNDRFTSSMRSALERVGSYGQAAIKAFVTDDWNALTGAHSTPMQRAVGAVDLASWGIPEGRAAEIAGRALAQVSAHLASSGIEHTSAAAAMWIPRALERPLTEAERSGHFQSHEDFAAFMGPATERGGVKQDWHHIVEKIHADKHGQFSPEQIHSVDNIIAVPRDLHQGRGGLTADFNEIDPRLGKSVREHLQGQPFDVHVAQGERALLTRGIDPIAQRAVTRARFEERLVQHDRKLELSQTHGLPQVIAPNLLAATTGTRSDDRNRQGDHNSSGATRDGQNAAWTPEMSHDDFAKLQARVRGGSAAPDARGPLHVEMNGNARTVGPTQRLEGTIQSVEGDRVVQHIGRGTATWSREELAKHFDDPKALDAMLQPGNYVNIGADRNGVVDVRQRAPDRSWESLGHQELAPHQQSLGHGLGR